jgi:hypothetical protein
MSLRYYRNGQATSLSDAVTAFDTSVSVDQASGFPTQFPYTLILDPDTLFEEVVDVTAVSGTTLTVARGVDGTTASAHAAGALVYHGVSARDHAEANSHVNATTNVHGTSGAIVDTDSDQAISGDKVFTGTLETSGGPVVAVGGTQTITGDKTFSGVLATSAGGAVATLGGTQTITGNKTSTGAEVHQGVESHAGAETHTGTEVHEGNATFNNPVVFTDALTLDGFNLESTGSAYTPAWTTTGAGADPSLGNGTLVGRYFRIGKLVIVWVTLTIGTTTNAGSGVWEISLPFARDVSAGHLGIASIVQTGVTTRVGLVAAAGSLIGVTADGFLAACDASTPHGWSSSNSLRIAYLYTTSE